MSPEKEQLKKQLLNSGTDSFRFRNASHSSRLNIAPNSKGVLSYEEAEQRIRLTKSLSVIECRIYGVKEKRDEKSIADRVYFFTDNYILGYLDGATNLLPEGWVPSSTQFPLSVAPRPSLPSGQITNLEEYLLIFGEKPEQSKNIRRLNSMDELVDFLYDVQGVRPFPNVV